jgi:hypothetical protein
MGVVGRIDSAGENTIVEMGKTTKDLLCQRKRERATGRRGCDREEGRSSTGLGPENYGCQEGEADSQGSGHAVRRLRINSRHGCIEGSWSSPVVWGLRPRGKLAHRYAKHLEER